MPNQRPIIPITMLITIVVIAILMVGVAWWYQNNKEKPTSETEYYIACGCGCCGGMESQEKCLYHSRGDNLQKIIEEDRKIAQSSECSLMGCSQPIKYKYCDKNKPVTNSNASANTNSNTIDAAYIRNKYCDKTYGDNLSLIKEITDCERGYRLEREDKSCVIINSQDQLECSDCGSASCLVDLGACVGTNSCWYISNTNTNANTNTEISSKYCTQDSDCGLLVCMGCYSQEYLKTAPPDLPCREYDGYACQCVKNRCLEIRPDRPYDFPSIRDEANCLALSAEWVSVGKMMRCEMPAPDAGKTCTKASDCIRYCSLENVNDATGTCSAHSGTSCYRFFNENGKLDGLCID